LVSEQAGSGHGVAAFCRERGLAASQFFAWKKRLSQAAPNQFVEVQVVGTGAEAQPTAARGGAIEVRLGGGRCVVVEPGFDADHQRAVVAALEARA
jgi:transposase-like protein